MSTETGAESPTMSNIARRRDLARHGDGEVYRERRDAILGAAAAVFQEKGVARAALDDVAHRVGLERASLYYYFANKEQLVEELLGLAVEDNVMTAEQIAASDADARTKLHDVVLAMMSSFARHYPYLYVFVDEYLSGARISADSDWMHRAEAMARRYDLAIRRIVADGIVEGVFRDVARPRTIAHAVVGMVNSTSTWFRPTCPEQADRVADVFVSMLLDGLATGSTAPREGGRPT